MNFAKKLKSTFILMMMCIVCAKAQTLETDPLVKTLKEELTSTMNQLKAKPVPAYFMSLRLVDNQGIVMRSVFGQTDYMEDHSRYVVPMIRVGSMELDNYKYENQQCPNDYEGLVPLTDAPLCTYRDEIWTECMKRYKTAVDEYKKAVTRARTEAETEDKAPCYSAAPVEKYYEKELPKMSVDTMSLKRILNKVTKYFKDTRLLEDGVVNAVFRTERKYIVNTDGTAVVQNSRQVQLFMTASIKANDGMVCSLYNSYFGFKEGELPSEEKLMADAKKLVERLVALRDAPLADPYTGPAIFSAAASGVLFHEIFGHRLESHRAKMDGQTFKKMINDKVLPETFNVYSDPNIDYYHGRAMRGYYLYDDEGVKAQRVNNVEKGIFKSFLCSRIPVDGFLQSNGHGRAQGRRDPVARQSNLIVESEHPYTDAQLREMLIKEAKKQGKEYGYYFHSVSGGFTEMINLNMFNITPLEVYRIYVDGRKDELVRAVNLIGTPLSVFSCIEAGGAYDEGFFFGDCGAESGWVPVTAPSPAVFVTKIETQRSGDRKNVPLVLPKPEYASEPDINKEAEEKVVFKVLEDEMQRTKDSLKMENSSLPYFVDYRIAHEKELRIRASLGGVLEVDYTPSQYIGHVHMCLGDKMVTSQLESHHNGESFGLGSNLDYDIFRNSFWNVSDVIYKICVNHISEKKNRLDQRPLPEEEQSIPERIEMPACEYLEAPVATQSVDTVKLKSLVSAMSAVFVDYPMLFDNDVILTENLVDLYRLTSEGVKIRLPQSTLHINVNTQVQAVDGSIIRDELNIGVSDDRNLPSEEELVARTREFCELLVKKSLAPAIKEYYIGPIMLEDEAVGEAICKRLVGAVGIAQRDMYRGSSKSSMMLGKRVADTKLSIHQWTDTPEYKGEKLYADYRVDVDGVTPKKDMALIEKGILKNLICGTKPALGALESTGNERPSGLRSSVSPGVIYANVDKCIAYSKMKDVLIKEAKRAGLDHTYIVKAPKYGLHYLVRLDVNTGEEQIVRSGDIPLPSKSDLMHISAASKEEFVANKSVGGLISVIAPKAIVVENIEYLFDKPSRAEEQQLKSPLLR